jgi:hypothetical protein
VTDTGTARILSWSDTLRMAYHPDDVDDLWAALHESLGEDLRVVTRYEGATFETRMPADVRDEYDPTQDQAIVDDLVGCPH